MTSVTKKPFSPEEFKEVFSKVPRLCVEVLLRKGDGIVLTKRAAVSWNGKWHVPGSMVHYGEDPIDTVGRMLREETGTEKFTLLAELGHSIYPSEAIERGFGWSVALVFACAHEEGDLRPDQDASDIRVFNELPVPEMIQEQRDYILGKYAGKLRELGFNLTISK